MFRTTLPLIFGLLLSLTAGADTAKSTTDAKMKSTPQAASKADAAVPTGYVLVEDYVMVDLKQLPLDMLALAETEYSNKNFGEAAADLRAAGRVFRIEAKQADIKDGKKELTTAASDLDKLADDVKNEAIKNSDALRTQIAKALYHDAAHHRMMAAKEWDLKQYHRAGDDLHIAAAAADMAALWADKDLALANKAAVEKARDVADRLTRNEGWTSGDVTDALDKLDVVVRGLGNKVMPARARAGETPTEL